MTTDLARVTVNLGPRAVRALGAACSRTGDSQTDTINRALTAYRVVLDLADRTGELVFVNAGGQRERVYLL